MSRGFHCLRPCLRSTQPRRLPPSIILSPFHNRFHASPTSNIQSNESPVFASADAQQRWIELRGLKGPLYPRAPASDHTSCQDFLTSYENLGPNETVDGKDITICGMPER